MTSIKELDAAVIDESGLVKYFDGGIPLKVVSRRNFTANEMDEMKSSAGTTYGVLSEPFRDSAGREVGSITVFDELAPEPWKSSHDEQRALSRNSSKVWGMLAVIVLSGAVVAYRYVGSPQPKAKLETKPPQNAV